MKRRTALATLGTAAASLAGIGLIARRFAHEARSPGALPESAFVELVVLLAPWSPEERNEAVLFGRALEATVASRDLDAERLRAKLSELHDGSSFDLGKLEVELREQVVRLLHAIYSTVPAQGRLLAYVATGMCHGGDVHTQSPAELGRRLPPLVTGSER